MAKGRILVCDDEELVRWSLVEHLRSEGYDVAEATNGRECVDKHAEWLPALVLLDLSMPEMDGMTALRTLREQGSDTPVIILTALGDVGSAIQATRLGADRYMTKPFDLHAVDEAVAEVLDVHRLRATVGEGGSEARGYAGLIGGSRPMQLVFETLRDLETIEAPTVLITGESGTGKDLIARAIHSHGPRGEQPFVEVDCTAIPETLIESTLFGHERGAFTDAKAQHRGLFESAQGGVVFLDEIGELPAPMQAKLLRALENRSFKRVGGTTTIRFDAAIVTATNRDLKAEVDAGNFREDLYYRLNVVPIALPPLRSRGDDVRLLVEHFIGSFNTSFGREVKGVQGAAMDALLQYRWPGNIRELRNVIERIVIFKKDALITVEDLPPAIRFGRSTSSSGCPFVLPPEGVELEAVERGLVEQALERTSGNQSAAARLLGLSRYALRNRMKKFELG